MYRKQMNAGERVSAEGNVNTGTVLLDTGSITRWLSFGQPKSDGELLAMQIAQRAEAFISALIFMQS